MSIFLAIILCSLTLPTVTLSLSTFQIPSPPCPLPVWQVSDLLWHNSTHNLDCTPRSLLPPSSNGTRLRPSPSSLANSLLCMTGADTQPPGYGPPDIFSVNITSVGPCHQRNPGSVPPRQVGKGWIRCGSSAPVLYFEGDSNSEHSRAEMRVSQQITCPGVDEDGDRTLGLYTVNGKVKLELTCSHDDGGNATCVSAQPIFQIPVTGWQRGAGRMLLIGDDEWSQL